MSCRDVRLQGNSTAEITRPSAADWAIKSSFIGVFKGN
jgi:hypothetical protein